MRRLLDPAIALALGLVLIALALPRAVTGEESLIPAGVLVGDPTRVGGFASPPRRDWDSSAALVHFPADTVAVQELRRGRLPLWNPYAGAGLPLLAEAHSAPLSPFLLPFLACPDERGYTLFMLLRPVVAAAGAFLLARRRGAGRGASALAAAAYALGGVAVSRFDLPTEGTAHAMLPFLVLAADAAVAGGRRGVGALALVTGLTILSAHPELAALAGVGAVLLAAPTNARALGRLVAGLLLGAAVAGIVVVPFAAYVGGGAAASYKLDAGLAGLFHSDVTWFRASPDFLRFGAAPLLLATIASLAAIRGGLPASRRAALGAGLAVAFVAAHFVFHVLAPQPWGALVPPRYSFFLVSLGVALLAAEGADALATGAPRLPLLAAGAALAVPLWVLLDRMTRWRLGRLADVRSGEIAQAGALVLLVVAALLAPRLRRAVPVVLAAVVAVTLAASTGRALSGSPARFPRTGATSALAGARPPARVAGIGAALAPNTSALLGVADARAVAAVFPARYRAYFGAMEGADLRATSIGLDQAGSPLLDLLGVELVAGAPDELPPAWPRTYAEAGVAVARNPRAAPRAFAPVELVAASSPAESLARLRELAASGRLPAAAVVEAPAAALAGRLGPAAVGVRVHEPGRVVLDVAADGPALVVLTDSYASGWRAEVDGKPAPIYAVDHLFRGVPVERGRHTVVFSYAPRSVDLGIALSVAATLLALWMCRRRG